MKKIIAGLILALALVVVANPVKADEVDSTTTPTVRHNYSGSTPQSRLFYLTQGKIDIVNPTSEQLSIINALNELIVELDVILASQSK